MFNSPTLNSESRTPILLRLFRPPLAASVEVQAGHPVRVDSRRVRGHVVSVAGPWRTSGAWWADDPWERDEWEVEIAVVNRHLPVGNYLRHVDRVESRKLKVKGIRCYRIYCDLRKEHWFVSGIYD